MLLANICSKNEETAKCVSHSSTECDRQEFPFNLSVINSLSSNSLYYEEGQFSTQINEPPTKPCQNVQKSFETPTVEIRDECTTSVDLPPISWHGYNCIPKFLTICNTGRSILINGQWASGKPYIEGGPLNGSYMFSQIHFHSPSEHQIDGKRFPLEMHVVHYKTSYLTQERAMKEKDGTVVLVYLFQVKDTCDTVLSCFTKHSSEIKAVNNQSEITGIALNHIVQPFYSHYYIYWGSISTKGNSYLLQWIINCSNLYATKQEVHDLFYLLESGDSHDERGNYSMKPLNNTIYYAGGYSLALKSLGKTATQCNDCYSNHDSLMSQCCQTISTFKEKKKDVQVQVSSGGNCSVKGNDLIKVYLKKCDPNESYMHEVVIKPSSECHEEEKKSGNCLEISLSDLECLVSSNDKNCILAEISPQPTAFLDAPCQCPAKLKKKHRIVLKSLKIENPCSKTENPCSKTFKKKKNCDTEETALKCKSKSNQVKCKEKPKCEKKEKSKTKDPAEGESSHKSKFSRSKSKCKIKTSDCNTNVPTCETEENCNEAPPKNSDCAVNFLLTPSTLQSIPSFPLMSSESEEIKKIKDVKNATDCDLKIPDKISKSLGSTYQPPQGKSKQPFTEFFLQTEHLFHTQKKRDFSMCTTQDYNVSIMHKQNVLQEFKGTFSPNKLEIGNYEKLNLIPKYPEPDNVRVHLEDCIVKMETLSKLCIRSKFLLEPDCNVMQSSKSDVLEKTATESTNLANQKTQIKFAEIQEGNGMGETESSNEDCDQPLNLVNIKKQKATNNVKQRLSNKSVSENKEWEKQDYEIELLKGPPEEVETSKSNIFDSSDQACETKVEEIKSQKSLTKKSDKNLKSLFRNRKKTLFFTYEKVEKDESSGKKIFVGKFRTKNEIKAFSKGKKLIQKNESYSTAEKAIETKEEDFLSLSNKELVVEEPLNCEIPMERQELKNESFLESKESYKIDNDKNVFMLHHFNPEQSESKISESKSKHLTFQEEGLTITPDSHFPQNILLKQSNAGSLTVKIQKSASVMDSKGPQIIIPVELDSRKFKQTEIEIQVSQDSLSLEDENSKKKYVPRSNH